MSGPDATIFWKGDEYIWSGTEHTCSICGNPCHWISISFEGAFCSAKCADKMWNDYFAACQKTEKQALVRERWSMKYWHRHLGGSHETARQG